MKMQTATGSIYNAGRFIQPRTVHMPPVELQPQMLNSHAIFLITQCVQPLLYNACEMAPTGSAFSLLTSVEGWATASTVREINPFITVTVPARTSYCRSKTLETIIKGEGLWLLINAIV